jgi:PhnB protein
MQVNPYLWFDGRCAEAFGSYAQLLGGEIAMLQTHADSPAAAQAPPGWGDKIMHARLLVGDAVLMGSDVPPPHHQAPQGFSVSLQVDRIAEGERIFNGLAEGGAVRMPFQPTFWAAGFGMCVDRFGIPWMVNCDKEQ